MAIASIHAAAASATASSAAAVARVMHADVGAHARQLVIYPGVCVAARVGGGQEAAAAAAAGNLGARSHVRLFPPPRPRRPPRPH